ncbi:MAG: PKD domain-containing protein [Bacteroidota bacterium]|nr:PKD domain-containing protein [Bacteroidota bacterium]
MIKKTLTILFIFALAALQSQTVNEKLYAQFSIVKDSSSISPFSFSFSDRSTGNVVDWLWDFGDGSTSDKKTCHHNYKKPGIYNVCLTIGTLDEDDNYEENVICKKVRVAEKGYFNLGGHVFVGQLPIEGGIAYLYKFDSIGNLHPIDTSSFDTLGFYYFYHKKDGKYLIKAEANHDLGQYSSYMPTYYGDVTQWEEAPIIMFDTTMFEYNINLQHSSFTTPGSGKIIGTIVYEGGRSSKETIAKDIPIYLKDANNRTVCLYSNENGEFEFNKIMLGYYSLKAEVTGINSVNHHEQLSNNQPESQEITFVIKSDQVVAAIPEETLLEIEDEISQVYPNPAYNEINLKIVAEINKEYNLKIYDQVGRLVYLRDVHLDDINNTISINTSGLSKGYYNITISSNRGSGQFRRFIKL